MYYNKAREVLSGNASLVSIAYDLDNTVNSNMTGTITNFVVRTNRHFDSGEGFYGWRGLRYFLYEYEYEKIVKNNLTRVGWNWNMFTRVEKDKVTIEHILPQTLTEYWHNMFRAFTDEQIKQLSASLGNLLPLSQSINSSLQNGSFPDKKDSSSRKNRGYINGSHSEIEVAQETEWTAQSILNRGMHLLAFMETRWKLKLTDEEKSALLHIPFVNDSRDVPQ